MTAMIKALAILGLVGAMSCTRPYNPRVFARNVVDQFATKLTGIIAAGNEGAYLDLFLREGDLAWNDLTDKPSEVPIKLENVDHNNASEVFRSLLKRGQVQQQRQVKLDRIEYFVDEHPWKRRSGLMEFETKLFLQINGDQLIIVQSGCILTARGVCIGEPFVIEHTPAAKPKPSGF